MLTFSSTQKSGIIFLFVLMAFLLLLAPAVTLGQENFVPLAPIPGVTEDAEQDPGAFFNGLFRIGIVIAAFLAIIMIIIGGFEYMTSEIPGDKSDGKKKITNAIIGLLLILVSVILLNIINPDILIFRFFSSP